MTFQAKKHFSGLDNSLKSAFFILSAVLFLTGITPTGLAGTKLPPKKSSTTYVQQIGPAGGQAPLDIGKVYSAVPEGKPLRVSTQFKVVDDFNAGELKNSLGGAWTRKRSGWI